jgi:hypothetical protein
VTLSFNQGETAEEMGAKCRKHVMEMMQSGDEDHKAAVESHDATEQRRARKVVRRVQK